MVNTHPRPTQVHTSAFTSHIYKKLNKYTLLAGCVAQNVCRLKLINSTNKIRTLQKGRSNKTVRHKQRQYVIHIMKKEYGKYRGKRWTGISREGEMNTKGKTRTAAGWPGDAEKTSRQRSVIRLSDCISALIWWLRNKLILLKPSKQFSTTFRRYKILARGGLDSSLVLRWMTKYKV